MNKISTDKLFVLSNYNNDIDWLLEYTNNYIIYEKSDKKISTGNIDVRKIIKSPNIGYNIYDYFTYIIDNYDNLPDKIVFLKGNCFPRHVSREYFESIVNKDTFTAMLDIKMHNPEMPTSFIKDGIYYEINNDWYFKKWENKYFGRYNDFLKYVYENPTIPEYIPFVPGAQYILKKENILKIPKKIYSDMRIFISYCQLPAEAHMIERALYTLWTSNEKINPESLKLPVNNRNFISRKLYFKQKLIRFILSRTDNALIMWMLKQINKVRK